MNNPQDSKALKTDEEWQLQLKNSTKILFIYETHY